MGVAFPARVRASRDDRCGVARVLVQMCCALRATAVAARSEVLLECSLVRKRSPNDK